MATGYLQETLKLIQEIEGKNEIDFKNYKDRFFSIELKIRTIKNYEQSYGELIKKKLKNIMEIKALTSHVLIAYLNMIDELGKSKNAFYQCSVICLMIPVICELIRKSGK